MADYTEFHVDNMHCTSCVKKIEAALLPLTDVREVKVDVVGNTVMVDGGDPADVISALSQIGHEARLLQPASVSQVSLTVCTLGDVADIESLQPLLSAVAGVAEVVINPVSQTLSLQGDFRLSEVMFLLKAHHVEVELVEQKAALAQSTSQDALAMKTSYKKAALAAVVGLLLMLFELLSHEWTILPNLSTASRGALGWSPTLFWSLMLLLTLATMVYSGKQYYLSAWQQLKHAAVNMDTLIALGTGAALLYSAVVIVFSTVLAKELLHLYLDTAVIILAFLNIGQALETKAKGKTSEAIAKLIGLQPHVATVVQNGETIELPVEHLSLGDIVRIFPGAKVAVDAEVMAGSSRVDESMLTGEPAPVLKQKGSMVYAGTLNSNGSLDVAITKSNDQTVLAGIIALVKSAQVSKPKIGRLVDQVTSVFVPIVVLIAVITFIIWSFFSLPHAVTAAIAVLVIACPCALGLGTPIAIMVATGRAAEEGMLIRNGAALQLASELTYVVFDKTGTITTGVPSVVDCHYLTDRVADIHADIHAIEMRSEHPLALAMTAWTAKDQQNHPVQHFKAVSARGVMAEVAAKSIVIGNEQWMQDNAIALEPSVLEVVQQYGQQAATPVLVAVDGELVAVFAVADPIKPEAEQTILRLHQLGIQTAMMSGDHPITANAVAKQVGIQTVMAQLAPKDKADFVKQLQAKGEIVGMVGDGINDAPALTQAHVGFAIGSGTDVAIESADVTLSSHSLDRVERAIRLSRATLSTIKRTLFGAFIYNALGVLLAAGVFYPFWHVLLSPMIASAAMAASSVTVVLVASRLQYHGITKA